MKKEKMPDERPEEPTAPNGGLVTVATKLAKRYQETADAIEVKKQIIEDVEARVEDHKRDLEILMAQKSVLKAQMFETTTNPYRCS